MVLVSWKVEHIQIFHVLAIWWKFRHRIQLSDLIRSICPFRQWILILSFLLSAMIVVRCIWELLKIESNLCSNRWSNVYILHWKFNVYVVFDSFSLKKLRVDSLTYICALEIKFEKKKFFLSFSLPLRVDRCRVHFSDSKHRREKVPWSDI